jgi:hypothetical protein
MEKIALKLLKKNFLTNFRELEKVLENRNSNVQYLINNLYFSVIKDTDNLSKLLKK